MLVKDALHLGLMLVAVGAAYLVPFELLLLSYAVLGPAHYFTEISWLHDRKYFLPHRGIGLALVIAAITAVLIAKPWWFGLIVWSALVVCAILAATSSTVQAIVLFVIAIGMAVAMYSGETFVLLGILIPTLVHVSLFTLVFMALGAYRSSSKAQGLLVVAYLVAIVMILAIPPTASTRIASFARLGQEYFGDVGPALGKLFGVPDLRLDTRFTSLLAFAYTYHYLNWFIKADVIRWANVSKVRLALVISASAASTALYFYDYAIGFLTLFIIALAHILLEFPLNSIALRDLGAIGGRSILRKLGLQSAPPLAQRSSPAGSKASRRATSQ